ncbi:hypothetical protein CEV34_2611 [Brucella pseudogrignonensis]|uniref:Uncharacterized protein n=1 Tax=Brucella pseudogrignonensis TaxID=419475 RepID=A0A256GFG7_9HYPH|nr:hypothetical protein CEV34_2611 [Brucella pseudogrignonensis]
MRLKRFQIKLNVGTATIIPSCALSHAKPLRTFAGNALLIYALSYAKLLYTFAGNAFNA